MVSDVRFSFSRLSKKEKMDAFLVMLSIAMQIVHTILKNCY